jgi:group I intron endonuclease
MKREQLNNNSSGIYKIRNTINEHCYIGSAVNIKERWREHRRDLFKNKHHSKYLQRAWNKYGEACFEFSIIEVCEPSTLIVREQYHINVLKPEYNIAPIAGSVLGLRHTEETRRKISLANKGRPSPRLGIKTTVEAVEKMRNALKTPEIQRKLSMWQKGKPKSIEHRAKLAEANKGKKHSPETIAKMSAAQTGKKASEETRKKLSIARRSRKEKERTPEHKANISKGIRSWWASKKNRAG